MVTDKHIEWAKAKSKESWPNVEKEMKERQKVFMESSEATYEEFSEIESNKERVERMVELSDEILNEVATSVGKLVGVVGIMAQEDDPNDTALVVARDVVEKTATILKHGAMMRQAALTVLTDPRILEEEEGDE